MFEIVALCAVVDVVEHDDAGDEVHGLAGRQEVQVGPAVSSPVAVASATESRRHSKQNQVQVHKQTFRNARHDTTQSEGPCPGHTERPEDKEQRLNVTRAS